MASPRPPTSVTPANASVPTPAKPPSPNPAPAPPNAAPPTPSPTSVPAPAPNVIPPASSASPIQHSSTTQATKSVPTGTSSSPSSNQSPLQNDDSRSSPPPATTSKASVGSSNNETAASLPSPSSTASGSHAASVWGAIFAVLGVIIALIATFWFLRRRREKSRRLWDAQRMPASNFGKYEGEIIPEKQASIEATLAADLARLRNLDQQGPIVYQNYDREFPKQSFDYSAKPVSPTGFKIARKPSLRVRDPIALLPPSPTGIIDQADRPSAPAYDAKEYIEDFSTKETRISNSHITKSSPHRNPDFY